MLQEPQNYLQLLRAISQRIKPSDERKYELLTREIQPLIPGTLSLSLSSASFLSDPLLPLNRYYSQLAAH